MYNSEMYLLEKQANRRTTAIKFVNGLSYSPNKGLGSRVKNSAFSILGQGLIVLGTRLQTIQTDPAFRQTGLAKHPVK